MSQLKADIDSLKHSKNEEDRKRCIPLLSQYLKENPIDVQAWFDLACCYDFLGFEKDSEPAYQKAYDMGWHKLSSEDQRDFFVGYGSTLRNNRKFEPSERILREGIEKFPQDPSLKVFLALTLYSRGNYQECSKALFDSIAKLPLDNFDGYEKAIQWYAIHLDHPQKKSK